MTLLPTGGSIPDPQPLKAVLAQRRISNRALARAISCSPGYVGLVANGYEPGSDQLRARIAGLLGLPEAALFRPREQAPAYPGDQVLETTR